MGEGSQVSSRPQAEAVAHVPSDPQVSLEVRTPGPGTADSVLPAPGCRWRRRAGLAPALTACWFEAPGPGPLPAAGLKLTRLCARQRREAGALTCTCDSPVPHSHDSAFISAVPFL